MNLEVTLECGIPDSATNFNGYIQKSYSEYSSMLAEFDKKMDLTLFPPQRVYQARRIIQDRLPLLGKLGAFHYTEATDLRIPQARDSYITEARAIAKLCREQVRSLLKEMISLRKK